MEVTTMEGDKLNLGGALALGVIHWYTGLGRKIETLLLWSSKIHTRRN